MPQSKFISDPRVGAVGEKSGPKLKFFTGKFAGLGSLFLKQQTKELQQLSQRIVAQQICLKTWDMLINS